MQRGTLAGVSADLVQVLMQFDPDPQAIIDELRGHVTDEIIRNIAGWDCGWGFDENYAILTTIKKTGVVPNPLEWEPKEVCELIRWNDPVIFDPEQINKAGEEDRSHHLERAFACAILLRFAEANDEHYSMGENSTAAALIASALVLGGPCIGLVGRCLASLGMTPHLDDGERGLIALGVLICGAEQRSVAPTKLNLLAEAILSFESTVRAEQAFHCWTEEWLFGLTNYGQRFPLWKSLARHVLLEPATSHPAEADAALRRIGRLVVG